MVQPSLDQGVFDDVVINVWSRHSEYLCGVDSAAIYYNIRFSGWVLPPLRVGKSFDWVVCRRTHCQLRFLKKCTL